MAFSLFVIATWGYFDLALFLAVLFVNFLGARAIDRADAHRGKAILIGFIALDVATLGFFKYANFIGGNVGALTGLHLPAFPLGIPLAISFYIFHLISYLVDLHARRVRLTTVREYIFYLSFFPHVIAGPIVRAWQLVPQIGHIRRIRGDLTLGFHFLVTGYFLKMVVANNVGRIIDPYFKGEALAHASAVDLWLVAFLYYCQIYGDFAGYSLMALGMARLLGYRLPANFRSPMRAGSIQEFWQRWHITLSRWLRDYLYIPMGGNRVSPGRSARNVMATMALGGLWHGAGWGFVLWGCWHGVGIVAERFLAPPRQDRPWLSRLAWAILAQVWITIAWVLFRSPTFSIASLYLSKMVHLTSHSQFVVNRTLFLCVLFAAPAVAHNFVPLLLKAAGRKRLGLILGVSTALMLVLNFMIYSPDTVFIYFRF